MRKYIILFLVGILFFELTFLVALNFFDKTNEEFVDSEIEKVMKINQFTKTEETSIDDNKIGINTKLVVEEFYTNCDHKNEIKKDVEKDMINLTQEEFEKNYLQYKVKEFSKEKIVVEEEISGICNEHFKIVLGEDFIEVFKLDSNEEEELYLVTDISRDYLTDEDIYNLDNGIIVYGRENINLKLEDYE